MILEKGWAILSEAQLGQYELIAFAGKFEVETSATCYVKRAILQFLIMVRFLALYIFKLKKKHR